MSVVTNQFSILQKQLDAELHTLSSESKRRNSKIKNASDKSIKILKTVHNYDDLLRHPDFVLPFTMASSSRNAKLTSIAIQCLQGLSSSECIPKERLSEVLDGFIESTHLAMEIQLKILQVVPIFFKTYGRYITGELCAKLLECCANLLQVPHKSSIVAGTASATLQQLINEIFDRLSFDWKTLTNDETINELDEKFDVLINNSDSIKVDTYRYDANKLFTALFSSIDVKNINSEVTEEVRSYLNINELPMDYGLEILESILLNNQDAFVQYEDLQFILKIKGIPLLLRAVSTPKSFATAVRSCRCIILLSKKEYLPMFELELEVILSLLIHNLSLTSQLPNWHRILVLEVFNEISNDLEMIIDVFLSFDKFDDRKHIIDNLLAECYKLLKSEECVAYLGESPIIEKMDVPLISNDEMNSKTGYLHLLDKTHAPSTNHGYIIWLILNFTNLWSEKLNTLILDENQKSQKLNNENIVSFYNGIFPGLFLIQKLLLYSTSLESHLFHTVVRAFQKLGYSAGILGIQQSLKQCIETFSNSIVNNHVTKTVTKEVGQSESSESNNNNNTTSGYLTAISETLIGSSNEQNPRNEKSDKKFLHPRSFNSRQISLFRALISLSISLGSALEPENWQSVFLTWQWVSYYIYGPSIDFMESFYSEDIPNAPAISKNDISTIEGSILKLFESTASYSSTSFQILLKCLITQSDSCIFIQHESYNYHPIDADRKIVECIYNKGFYITQIGEISTYNYGRFLVGQKGKDMWNLIINYFISLISNRSISSNSLRLYVARIFTDIIKNATDDVSNTNDQEASHKKFSVLEDFIMSALMDTINALSKLTITKNEIYKGILGTESEILLQILSTLKGILNEFGDSLTHSWLTVFNVINSPFELLNYDTNSLNTEDEEDAALANTIFQKHLEMIQISYDVFKLVSDDFLQALPLDIIRYVIDTLVNFATQNRSLNISFSSISQFWLVGDYLRTRKTDSCELPRDIISEFTEKIQSGKLLTILESDNTELYEVYNCLWIYLLKKLMKCTDDKRSEVKNGAIQTFYRIVDSHTNCLPPWKIIFSEVLKPLLTVNEKLEDADNYVEFYDVTINGLLKLYPIYFADLKSDESQLEPWLTLLNFLEVLFLTSPISIKFVAIGHFKGLLDAMVKIDDIPPVLLEKVQNIWMNYKIVYSDTQNVDPFNSKSEYDCVLELLLGFPLLFKLMNKANALTANFVEKSLSIVNAASRYPLLPEHSNDKIRPSSLQKAILDCLSLFDGKQSAEIELLLLFQVSSICTLTFDTREKIEAKLGPKLSRTTANRVPTFEAFSYNASEILFTRLNLLDSGYHIPFEKEKYLLRILKNLSEIIRRKSTIGMILNEKPAIWVMASQSFRLLIVKIISTNSDKSSQFKNDFHEIFIAAITNSIDKVTDHQQITDQQEDIEEYVKYRDIFLQEDVVSSMTEEQLRYFITIIWKNSLIFHLDEIEEILVNAKPTFTEVTEEVSKTNFGELFGSIIEPPLYNNTQTSIVCMDDLIRFVKQQGTPYERLRNSTVPYLVCRVAFVLRRFILDENLLNKAPIPKLRKIELLSLLSGLCDIMRETSDNEENEVNSIVFKNLLILYPLILKTIPVSHKVEGLQDKVLDLSLAFTKLVSK